MNNLLPSDPKITLYSGSLNLQEIRLPSPLSHLGTSHVSTSQPGTPHLKH